MKMTLYEFEGKQPQIDNTAFVFPTAIIIGDVKIGKNCKISSHTFICEGVIIEDDVFIGHNVTFINDIYPRATAENGELKTEHDWTCIPTLIKKKASIGSSTTLLCGITIGENALVGAGSVVTKDVPPNSIVAGNPAKIIRIVDDVNRRDAKFAK